MKKIVMVFISALTLVAAMQASAAGDAAAGKAKAATCAGCHGANGVSANNLWPNLKGQKADYLVKQLKAFRDGQRQDPMMGGMAKSLTDADIANLAAFYSSL